MRSVILTVIVLCLTGCGVKRSEIMFCGVENGRFDREPMRFDIQERKIFGTDVSHQFEVVESELARGFVSPFPLTLPRTSSPIGSAPDRWELGGYTFVMTPLSSADPDWVLIHASATGQPHASITAQRTSVLYSLSRGVLAIRLSSKHEEEALDSEFFFCGTGHMDASTF